MKNYNVTVAKYHNHQDYDKEIKKIEISNNSILDIPSLINIKIRDSINIKKYWAYRILTYKEI